LNGATPVDAPPERATIPQRRVTAADSHVDARRAGLALVLCIGIFIVAIVGAVLPAQGVRGLVAAAGLLATVGAGSVLMARMMIDGRVRPRRLARDVDVVAPDRWQRD